MVLWKRLTPNRQRGLDTMRAYSVGCLVLLVLTAAPTSAQAAHWVSIGTPVSGTYFASGASIAVGGDSGWIPGWDYTPTNVKITVYNIRRWDGSNGPIQSQVWATSFSILTGDWEGATAAPWGNPGPTNAVFELRADLVANGSSEVANTSVGLVVTPYGGGS